MLGCDGRPIAGCQERERGSFLQWQENVMNSYRYYLKISTSGMSHSAVRLVKMAQGYRISRNYTTWNATNASLAGRNNLQSERTVFAEHSFAAKSTCTVSPLASVSNDSVCGHREES